MLFVVLACHKPVLDGFNPHFQASVLFPLTSAVNQSQQQWNNFLRTFKNQTWGHWARSKNATSVLCSPQKNCQELNCQDSLFFVCLSSIFLKMRLWIRIESISCQEKYRSEVEQLREEKASAAKRKLEEEEEESEAKRKKVKETKLKMLSKCNEELKCTICDELFISVRKTCWPISDPLTCHVSCQAVN